MKFNFCEATNVLAMGSVYGFLAFLLSLDHILNSGRPVSWASGLIFILVTILFAVNLALLLWSLVDPNWMQTARRRLRH